MIQTIEARLKVAFEDYLKFFFSEAMFELRNILTQTKYIFKKSCIIDGVTFSCTKNPEFIQLNLKNSTENLIRTQFGHSIKPGGNLKLEFDVQKSCTVTLDDRENPVLIRWDGQKTTNSFIEDMSLDSQDDQKIIETLDPKFKNGWSETENYLQFTKKIDTSKQKFAFFDMDYTMIKTASGRRFPKDHLDQC